MEPDAIITVITFFSMVLLNNRVISASIAARSRRSPASLLLNQGSTRSNLMVRTSRLTEGIENEMEAVIVYISTMQQTFYETDERPRANRDKKT
jgi:hypothetical protein